MNLNLISIRRKIVYGFALLLLLVSSTALLTSALVIQVERKVGRVEVIDDFLNHTLELRRFEKNYFLYAQPQDFDEILFYWQRLQLLLQQHGEDISQMLSTQRLEDIQAAMNAYREGVEDFQLLRQTPENNTPKERDLQQIVRHQGKLLTDFAEQASRDERTAIKSLLSTTKITLIFSASLLVVITVGMASVLVRRVISSLRLLEGYTRQIAQGEEILPPPAKAMEEEINTLLRAFQRMHHELQARQRQLIQSEKLAALGTLLAGVAHEINNPLSNISTSAQILLEESREQEDELQRTMLQQIETQTDKARDIVRTLLEFSRIKEFHRENLPLEQLLTSTLRLLKSQVAPGVEIKVDLPPQLSLFADKQRIQQVFLNLIKNALDALGDSGHLWITGQLVNKTDGDMVEIIIEDDGPGIEPEVQERIFDPFFTTKEVGRGSGLGLFVVYDIVASHGGELSVESRPGHGTTFIIWLPTEGAEQQQ